MAEIELREPLRLPSLALLAGAASAVGVPGTWGLWARRWLFDELAAVTPWATPVVLAATALLALAWLAPLALFWRRALPTAPEAQPALSGKPGVVLFVGLAAAPLLILGVAPGFAWEGWLAGLQDDLARGAAAPRLAWLAMPAETFASAWRGLLAISRGLRRGMALFEQRYYLAGLLIAVILVIMLFIQ
jgi:hypothetical protein